jgi:phosphoglycolate phosphatase-like HAD superfamily hydrolase
MVYGIPPFPNAREAITSLSNQADIIVVSATSRDALEREWEENGLLPYVSMICSQDEGSKKECIMMVKDHYAADRVLMMGDAPGDEKAAHENGVLFYPIRPGDEIRSWKEFREEYMRSFLDGTYQAEHEKTLIARFDKCLPVLPPWKLQKK